MQALGLTLALAFLGAGLLLNVAVLLYFVLRSIRALRRPRPSQALPAGGMLTPAHR